MATASGPPNTDVVYVTAGDRNWAKFFVNRRSGLVEIVEKMDSLMGPEGLARKVMSGFKTVEGVAVPLQTETFMDGKKVVAVTVKDIRFNLPVDERLFEIQ